jgi:hypothetical protein
MIQPPLLGRRIGQLAVLAILAASAATITPKPAAADDEGNH